MLAKMKKKKKVYLTEMKRAAVYYMSLLEYKLNLFFISFFVFVIHLQFQLNILCIRSH